MSTIERAADLLRNLTQGPQQRGPAGEGAVAERDALERASGALGQRQSTPEGRDPRRDASAAARPTRASSTTSRTLKVDRNRLREQNMVTPDGARTAVAESFRRIKRQILGNIAAGRAGAPPANLVMITSALPGEGKTYCSINLAISIALEMDRTVLLVDADVAKSDIPPALGFKADKGLMEVLLDRRVDVADVLWKTDIGNLTLLPVGTAHKHATELLTSESMRVLLRDMAQRYHDRVIIFDSPPLLSASEASALASQMGQIIVVVEAGKTSEATLKGALARIDESRVAGLLLNKAPTSPHEGYGTYG
jgi:exopolysaccharide/PEP-CTERM locus tyrosine autokinase